MKTASFEIKVALLGHVSVGKTTLLNALLGEKFSEVSKRRTTAGITHFSISPLPKPTTEILEEETVAFGKPDTGVDVLKGDVFTSSQTLKKITAENLNLRKQSQIQECTVNVEVNNPLIPMRPNTKLVITDIPGVNEAGTSDMYLDFVEKAWDTFDCAIVVMDAAQGVNTNEEVRLLQFVKTNVQNSKNIPVIILCNKVDDADDEELITLVDEIRSKVEDIFDVTDRNTALTNMIKPSGRANDEIKDPSNSSPAFLTLSAENAFVYRAASGLERNELQKLGKTYIDKIGHEEVGQFQWKRLSKEKKYDVVYNAVKDSSQYKERLASSNFDKFLRVLEVFIGGSEVQANLIEKQLSIAVMKLAPVAGFVSRMQTISDRSVTLGKSTTYLKDTFWRLYNQYKLASLEVFESHHSNLHMLYGPMKELELYACTLHLKLLFDKDDAIMKSDKEAILSAMNMLVAEQCDIVIKKEANGLTTNKDPWCFKVGYSGGKRKLYWYNNKSGKIRSGNSMKHPEADKYASHWKWDTNIKMWKSKYSSSTLPGSENANPKEAWHLSPRDWSNVISMLLMMKCNPRFCDDFGKEISNLEWCRSVSKRFLDPSCTDINIVVPDRGPSDPDHWGHLVWRYLRFSEKQKESAYNKEYYEIVKAPLEKHSNRMGTSQSLRKRKYVTDEKDKN